MFLRSANVALNYIFVVEKKSEKVADANAAHSDKIDTSALLQIFAKFFCFFLLEDQRILAFRYLYIHVGIVA